MSDGDLVYSTNPEIFQKEKLSGGLPPRAVIKARREKNNRGGKIVTVFFGFQASEKQCKELLKELKRGLGTGGTVRGGVVEIQGDQLAKASGILEKLGYKVKQAGA